MAKIMQFTTKKSQNIWNLLKMFLSLHRQNICFGYPGRIPRGARLYRYCPFKNHLPGWFFYFVYFTIKYLIYDSPNVSLRTIEINFFPFITRTSIASGFSSK